MANGRKGAAGSFGAPLDELLPSLMAGRDASQLKVDIHRKPDDAADPVSAADACRIFLLNQRLYERARK